MEDLLLAFERELIDFDLSRDDQVKTLCIAALGKKRLSLFIFLVKAYPGNFFELLAGEARRKWLLSLFLPNLHYSIPAFDTFDSLP